MTEKDIRAKYPVVDSLYQLIESKDLALTILPEAKELKAIFFREIEFKSPAFSCIIPVYDEYEDAKNQNPVILLQLILHACYEFEDHDDITTWSTAHGLDLTHSLALVLYKTLGEVVPKIREILGNVTEEIPDFDWQLNAGAAQALREMKF